MRESLIRVIILLSCAVSAIAQTTSSGLVLDLPFTNNANDESGLNNSINVIGATLTTDRFGNINGAYSFDGINDYISIPSNTNITVNKGKTISMWVNIDSANLAKNYTTLISKELSYYTYPTFHIQLFGPVYGNDKNKIGFFFGSNFTNYVSKSDKLYSKYLNRWINITTIYSYDDGYISLYLNDTICSKVYAGMGITSNIDNNVPVYIGRGNISSGETYFKGKIDDVRIYNRALTKSEISNIATGIENKKEKGELIKLTTDRQKKQIKINLSSCPELIGNSVISVSNILGETEHSSAIENINKIVQLRSIPESRLYIVQIISKNKHILSKKIIL
jgi:hypothetical protein